VSDEGTVMTTATVGAGRDRHAHESAVSINLPEFFSRSCQVARQADARIPARPKTAGPKLSPSAIQIEAVEAGDVQIPAEFRSAIYDGLVESRYAQAGVPRPCRESQQPRAPKLFCLCYGANSMWDRASATLLPDRPRSY
jgi:hypothetical protein